MSKQRKVQGGGGGGEGQLKQAVQAKTAEQADPQLANSYIASLMEIAAQQAGVTSSTLLSLAAENEQSSGKYDFPEDGDRQRQQAPLPELRSTHTEENYKDFEKGVAFVKGANDEHAVDANDAAQGALGNCYLIAGMIAVARANPQAIQDLIQDNGNGTFDVTLYIRESRFSPPRKVVTRVDSQLPARATGAPLYAKLGDTDAEGNVELWPALIEKAVAQQKGSYDLISGGNIAKGFNFHGATELLTGKAEGYLATAGMAEDDALLHMAIAIDDKKPCTCDSKNMASEAALESEAKTKNVYGNHAYIPEKVDLTGRTVDLTNPWGSSHVSKLSIADFLKYFRAIRVGA